MQRSIFLPFSVGAFALCALLVACDKEKPPATNGAGSTTTPTNPPETDPSHQNGDDHDHADGDHDHDEQPGHSHGETTALGEQAAGGFTVRASRDGDVTPGGDVPIDVWVTGGDSKVAAVRFWIGAEDAAGSVKARAANETGPTHWHTHAEAPTPMPEGSRLWVEIEREGGEKVVTGFDLKM